MLRFLSYIRKHQVAFVGGIDFAENRQDTYAPKFAIGKWMSSTLKCGSSDFVVWAGPNTSGLIHVLFRQDLGNVIEGNDYLPVQVAVDTRHPAGNEKPWQDNLRLTDGPSAVGRQSKVCCLSRACRLSLQPQDAMVKAGPRRGERSR